MFDIDFGNVGVILSQTAPHTIVCEYVGVCVYVYLQVNEYVYVLICMSVSLYICVSVCTSVSL